jgi:cytochrome c-type biogenesis protein CcmH
MDFLVARYGEFALLKPRFEPSTWALWFGPLAALLIGAAITWSVFRRGRQGTAHALDAEEKARLDKLLGRPE